MIKSSPFSGLGQEGLTKGLLWTRHCAGPGSQTAWAGGLEAWIWLKGLLTSHSFYCILLKEKCFLLRADALRGKTATGRSALETKRHSWRNRSAGRCCAVGGQLCWRARLGGPLYTLAPDSLMWSRWFRIYLLGSDASLQWTAVFRSFKKYSNNPRPWHQDQVNLQLLEILLYYPRQFTLYLGLLWELPDQLPSYFKIYKITYLKGLFTFFLWKAHPAIML